MTQVASLVANLELQSGSFVSSAERARRAMKQTADSIAADARKMSGALGTIESEVKRAAAAFQTAQVVVAAAFAGAATNAVVDFTRSMAAAGDQAVQLQAKLTGLTGSTEAFTLVKQTANEVGVAVADVSEIFGRFALAGKDVGLTTRQVQQLTETVLQLGRIGGGSTQELTAATQQLAQGLASGKLQGDELKSILENMPALARTLADELGVSIGQLREMGTEGKLTADVVSRALLGAADGVAERFKALPESLAQSEARFANAWQSVLVALDEKLHASDMWKFVTGQITAGLSNFAVDIVGTSDKGAILAERQRELKDAEAAVKRLQGNFDSPSFVFGNKELLGRQLDDAKEKAEALRRELIALQGVAQKDLAGDKEFAVNRPKAPKAPVLSAKEAQKAADEEFNRLKNRLVAEDEARKAAADVRSQYTRDELDEFEKAELAKVAAAKLAATKRRQDQEELQRRAKALTNESLTDLEKYRQKVAEVDALTKKGALQPADAERVKAGLKREYDEKQANSPAARVADAQAEIAQLKELQAALDVSAEKYHQVELRIAGERAARELGRDATLQERDAIAALTIEQEKLKEAMARSEKLDDMSAQIDQQERLNEAKDQSAKAYYDTAKAIEVERAVRELGIGATEAEIQRVRELAAAKYDAANQQQFDETYDPAAGAKEALRELADEAQQFGKLAGDAIKGAADLGAEAFAEFALTGKADMKSLAQEIERSLVQGAVRQLVNALVGVGGQAFAGWLGAPAAAGNGQSANTAIITAHAKGGVRSGPDIHEYANSIVREPTIFKFAKGGNLGLMGEAGPEAILPLARTSSGDLGVQMANPPAAPTAGGVVVNINDYRGGGEQVETSVRQSGDQTVLDVVIRDAHRRQVNGGEQDALYRQNYGSRPKPLR